MLVIRKLHIKPTKNINRPAAEAAGRWLPFVEMFSRAHALGRQITAASNEEPEPTTLLPLEPGAAGQGPKVIICSPHPDDELLTGALPLRLQQEQGATIINLAVTLGSNIARRQERLHELEQACGLIGFNSRLAAQPSGFERINPEARKAPDWPAKAKELATIFAEIKPDFILFPHAADHHPTHEGTHLLVMDALAAWHTGSSRIILVETEFWQPMPRPNLLVGLNNNDLALMLAALSRHKGEIARNPYHLSQPARMMDNVRRGRELIGQGDHSPDFLFGELCRISLWENGGRKIVDKAMVCGPEESLDFKL